MDLKTQTAVAPHTGGSAGDEESPVLWPLEDCYDPPKIDQSQDVAIVATLLDRSWNCHNVCNERILLWGLSGCGYANSLVTALLYCWKCY